VDEIEDIWQMAWMAPYWRSSVDASNAMSAIDGALWDILGKRAGMPVYDLLGGKVRTALPMFANVNGASLEQQEENARRAIETGYKYLRVGAVGGDGTRAGNGSAGGNRGPGGGGVAAGPEAFGERGPVYPQRAVESFYMNNLLASFEHLRKTIGFGTTSAARPTTGSRRARVSCSRRRSRSTVRSGSRRCSRPSTTSGTRCCGSRRARRSRSASCS
jgi:L-alanine-DL-glutamate epimerase-like enolase superfamily enzyme